MTDVPVLLGFLPLFLPAVLILFALLTGRISMNGLWYDSFRPGVLSPVRSTSS